MENLQPDWFSEDKVTNTYDTREMLAGGGHPVAKVLEDLANFEAGDIYELVTPFLPAPLLDKVKAQGFECWTKKENDNLFRNYFCKIK